MAATTATSTAVEPNWVSTVYGLYNFAGLFTSGWAVFILLVLWLRYLGPFREAGRLRLVGAAGDAGDPVRLGPRLRAEGSAESGATFLLDRYDLPARTFRLEGLPAHEDGDGEDEGEDDKAHGDASLASRRRPATLS